MSAVMRAHFDMVRQMIDVTKEVVGPGYTPEYYRQIANEYVQVAEAFAAATIEAMAS